MARSIDQQVVVITGASSGIGRTTARMLAAKGANVVATARSAADLQTLVAETADAPGTVADVVADVTDAAAMAQVAAVAVERFGRIDTWVGGAASSVYGRAWEIPPHEYETVMRTNWLGQVHGALAALPALRESRGTLICIGSVESVRAVPMHAPYVASKMALRGFCDSLRMDLEAEKTGVSVTLVMPASIDTPFFEHSKTYAEGAPKPPPPYYEPEAVAMAIIKAAQHPQREVAVGGSSFAFFTGQKFAPRLTDRLMTAGHAMARLQQADHPDDGRDNLDAPMQGTGTERGGLSGRRSFSTVLTTARPIVRKAAGMGAAAAGVAVTRLAARRGAEHPTTEANGEQEQRQEQTLTR
jgi:short-subunit dehydrogenase